MVNISKHVVLNLKIKIITLNIQLINENDNFTIFKAVVNILKLEFFVEPNLKIKIITMIIQLNNKNDHFTI